MTASDKIFVDLNEDIVFTLEKIRNSASSRVMIIIPNSANVTSSLISLKLLGRQILRTKKLVVLVTEDEVGLNLAKKAEIVAVEKVGDVTQEIWDEAKEKKEIQIAELDRVKRVLLDKRSEKIDPVEYKIIDEDIPSVENETPVSDTPREEESELKIVEKKRIPPRVIKLGGISFLAAGDIKNDSELLSELLPPVVSMEEEKAGEAQDETLDSSPEGDTHTLDNQNQEEVESDSASEENIEEDIEEIQKQRRKRSFLGQNLAYVEPSERPTRTFKSSFNPGSAKASAGFSELVGKSSDFFQKLDKKKLGIGLGIFVLLFLGYSFFAKSSAKVTVYLKTDDLTVNQTITADPDSSGIDENAFVIPAVVRSTKNDASENSIATGQGTIGNKAKGQVDIYNYTKNNIELKAGTVVIIEGSGLKYKLTSTVTVPKEGKIRDIGIEAETHGESYNANDFPKTFTVSGYKNEDLKVFSVTALVGGTSEETVVVSQDDLNTIKKVLGEKVRSTAATSLESLGGSDELLLPETIKVKTIKETASAQVGQAVEDFDLTIEAEVSAFFVKKSDIEEMVRKIAQKEQKIEGESEINIAQLPTPTNVKFEEGVATFQISTEASAKSAIDKDTLLNEIQGKSLSEARDFLESNPDIESYTMEVGPWFMPSFMRKIPEKSKITLTLRNS